MRVIDEHVIHPDQAFRLLSFEIDGSLGERHRHAALELTWIERGAGVRFVGDSAAPFESGDLVLLGSNLPHAWASSGPPHPGALKATVIQFPPHLLTQLVLPELATLRPLAARAGKGLRVTGQTQTRVTARLSRLPQAAPLGRLAGLFDILQELAGGDADLSTIAASTLRPPGHDPQRDRRIDRVIAWIHLHLDEDLSLGDAADVAHVSKAAFSRFFRRETGKTYSDYVNDIRCSEACVRLRQTADPVALIASACGFATLSHFNRQFQTRVGCTPREYRRRR
jgi:AraC-like DNA-binding protein